MELINTNATAYDSWLSANMSSLRKAIEHLEEPNTNDIIEVTGRMIWQAANAQAVPEGFVLVPKEIGNFDSPIANALEKGIVRDWPASEIYAAMIEAQEQAND